MCGCKATMRHDPTSPGAGRRPCAWEYALLTSLTVLWPAVVHTTPRPAVPMAHVFHNDSYALRAYVLTPSAARPGCPAPRLADPRVDAPHPARPDSTRSAATCRQHRGAPRSPDLFCG